MIGMVIAPSGSSVEAGARSHGVPTVPWDTRSNSSAGNLLGRLRFPVRQAEDFDCNLFHAWHTRGFEWGVSLARHLALPLVGTLHDDPTSRQNSACRRYLLRTSAHRMAGIAVVSQAMEQLCKGAGWTVPMAVIPNGLPDEPPTLRADPGSVARVGFLGLNELWKGITTVVALVESFQHLPVEWEMFGTPSPTVEAPLKNLLDRFPHKVRFHGRCSPAEIYSKVEIIIHPSLAFDPYPTVLLEAARAGIPVIASAIGGAPEIVVHRETGFLYPASDVEEARHSLRTLLENSAIRLKMGQAARARFEKHFRLSDMINDYETFWTKSLYQATHPSLEPCEI
jgi:glycosyltransferase involved in cell wall biosynthesis